MTRGGWNDVTASDGDSERTEPVEPPGGEQQVRAPVHGVTCTGCVATVRAGLADLAGVADLQVRPEADAGPGWLWGQWAVTPRPSSPWS